MNDRVEAAAAGAMPRASRVELVERLWQAASQQVRGHELRLRELGAAEAASEGHAKALATLARTIRELIDMDAAAIDIDRALEDADNPNDSDPDRALASLDSLREELARRMGLSSRGEKAGYSDGAEPG